MTISEAQKTADEKGAGSSAAPDFRTELPQGLVDPAVLARMATDFFTALPEVSPLRSELPPLAGALPPSLTGNILPATTQQSVIASPIAPDALPGNSVVTESGLSALPATLTTPSVPTPTPGALAAHAPYATIPGGLGTAVPSSISPSFSFLDDARSIFAAVPASQIPSEPSELGALVPDVSNSVASSSRADAAAPAVLGAPARPDPDARTTSYSFLGEARELSPVNVVPSLEAAGADAPRVTDLGLSSRSFDVNEIRRDFPILQERVNGHPLIWLDNAATTQKPQSVIDRLSYFYEHENSNVHRAAHELAARATDAYEAAREKVRRFLNASSVREIVFVRGATEGINLIAKSWGRQNVQKDDEIVITWLEHHANIVPWQMLCAEKGARLRVAPVDNSGQVLLDEYAKLLGPRTRIVSLAQVSNAFGTVTPAREMIEMARHHGATVVLDGAQAVSHMPVDVQFYDCDFYVFSGHKIFAPTGIGVVYGKSDVLDRTPPWQGGGNMIADVTFEKTLYQPPPGRFEAGTGNIADAVGLGAALDYVQRIGLPNIARYEHDLLAYALNALRGIPGLHLIGTPKEQAGVISFVLDGYRTEDVGTALNREGIAVRAGHHCAQPILRRFGLESTVRASLAFYNTCEEIDALVAAIWNLKGGRGPGL